MSRIKLLEIDKMNVEQRQQYERFPANLTRGLLVVGNSTTGYLSLGASFRGGVLKPRHREFVIVRVAALSKSPYERMQHLDTARQVGLSDIEIAAIENGKPGILNENEQLLLRYIDECVYNVKVSDGTFAEIRSFFSEREVAELTLLIGHYMMTARFVETLEIDLDQGATSWEGMKSS